MLRTNLKRDSIDNEKSIGEGIREVSSFPNEAFENDSLSSKEAIDRWNKMSSGEKADYEKRLVRKLDLRIIPWLTLLYLISFLDRTNIGNAKIQGLTEDLHLSDTQYALCLSVFFITYSLFEIPSNVLLKKLKPHVWLPAIMVSWGFILTMMGLVKGFGGLLTARLCLGVAEAGLFPGAQFYLSCWYKRNELGFRAALFFSAAALSGAFGGLLAAGIANLDGVAGLAGWSWIFILEGIFSVVIGVISIWIVVDFPDDATFLDPLERYVVISRLRSDGQASGRVEEFQWKYVVAVFKDWKTYTGMLMNMGVAGPLYSISLFLPSIIAELGYTSTQAQLLTVPPYALAFVSAISVGYFADRLLRRGIFNIAFGLIACAGFVILIVSRMPHLSYAGTFFAAVGIYSAAANNITWLNNNVEGVYKRAVAVASIIAWGNMNGIMSSNVYRSIDAPWYRWADCVVLGYLAIALVGGSILNLIFVKIANRMRDAGGELLRREKLEGLTDEEQRQLGDAHPDFRYTL